MVCCSIFVLLYVNVALTMEDEILEGLPLFSEPTVRRNEILPQCTVRIYKFHPSTAQIF